MHDHPVIIPARADLKTQAGIGLLLTGLSGSGKTTIAQCLADTLNDVQTQPAIILDGDYLRTTICADLGFSRQDRILNIHRATHLASEKIQAGNIVIMALIAPYAESRDFSRQIISMHGTYLEIYLSTPLSECIRRDPKGLYAKAREGIIRNFTGIDDPYETPENPDLVLDTTGITVGEGVASILNVLKLHSLIP